MKRLMYAAALVGIATLASAARADGVRVQVERLAKTTVVYDNPHLLDDLAKVWNDQREPLDRMIEKELTKLNPKLPKGVNFARQHVGQGNRFAVRTQRQPKDVTELSPKRRLLL